MASFPNTVISFCVFLLIMFSRSSRAYATNILLTGQTLGPEERLGYANAEFSLLMQFDCNLVIEESNGKRIWYSHSTCLGCNNCNLSFTDNGQLAIRDRSGYQRWITPNKNSKVGKYVAVFLPEGQFATYGPEVWSVGLNKESVSFNNNETMSSMNNLKNGPTVYNVLLSNQELHDTNKLFDNGYEFILKDCELVLKKNNGEILWRSWTRGYGDSCFAKLNYTGELSIRDGDKERIWSNEVSSKEGEYVLVLQQNGDVVIYGPKVWSTEDLRSGFIEMATVEK